MADYGLKYRAEFKNTRGHEYQLNIYQRGFTSTSKTIKTLCGCVLEIQGAQGDVTAPIIKTQLRFSLVDAWDIADTGSAKWGNWSEFYTPDATLYKVQLRSMSGSATSPIWTGYITPDSWQENLGYRTAITITARDNIGHLKDFPFQATGSVTPDSNGLIEIRYIFSQAMSVIDFPMTFNVESWGSGQYSADVPCTDNDDYLTEAQVNAELFDGMNWYDVLEQTLEATGYAFRYVGGNKCVICCLRNLPKVGHYSSETPIQTLEFYGGSMEFDPAVKQIEEKVDFKMQKDVPLETMAGIQYGSATTYRCKVDGNTLPGGGVVSIPEHDAPTNTISSPGSSVWGNGNQLFDPSGKQPDDFLRRSEGDDGWKQYAMIPSNRVNDYLPYTGFRFHTKTAAVKLTVNFTPHPLSIRHSGSMIGKMMEPGYSLSEIKYQVRYLNEDQSVIRYWNGAGWVNSDTGAVLTREYDAQNEYGTALEIELPECEDIDSGILVVAFYNIKYKIWYDGGDGVYARVQSILVGLISTRAVDSDKVTTINNTAYNVKIERRPLFGALSREVGYTKTSNYLAALFYYPFSGSAPEQFPYQVRFTDQSATVPLPVLIHQQILCYRHGAARMLNGRCAPLNKVPFDLSGLFAYKGTTYLLQGGTLDLFSGIMEGAVFHEFVDFNTLWTGTPTYIGDTTYNTGTPGTGYSGGNAGGAPIAPAITVDTALSTTSENPVQNKVITEAVNGKYTKPLTGIPATDLASGVIPDVSQFITRMVNDLVNYYTKSETYTKAEVAALIGAIQQFHYEIAASTSAVTSPSNNVLYLIGPSGSGADKYEEFVYDSTKQDPWIKIGDTSIDLSGLLPLTGGTLTGDLRLKPANANYGLRIRFGDGDYVYLLEDIDDHLIIYADRGVDLSTGSGYDVKVNGVKLTPADYVTMSTMQTITGEKTFTTKPVHIGSTSGIDVDGGSYIDIGDARLVWDSQTHSLHVTKRPGSSYTGSINMYADGDVGAGGVGSGATVNYVNCANQTAYNNITTKDPATIYTVGTAPAFSRIYLGTILIYES